MTDRRRPGAGPIPPKEPFPPRPVAGRQPISDPVTLIVFMGILAVASVALGVMALREDASVWLAVGIVVGMGGMSCAGLYVGVRRLRWKREYRRVMGHNPPT